MIQPLSKYTSYIFTFLLTLGMILSVNIFAATPEKTLGFQGQLYSHNLPLTSAVYATFTFYDAPTGGNTTGTPIAKTVTVNNGYFGTQFTESDTTGVDFNQQLYLEVSVNGTTLSPRTTVNPTVSSLKSFGTFSYTSAPSVGPVGSLYFNTTDNTLYMSNGTSWSPSSPWVNTSTSTYYMGGNVGIGTTTPLATLSVDGKGVFGNGMTSGRVSSLRSISAIDTAATIQIWRTVASTSPNNPGIEFIQGTNETRESSDNTWWDIYTSANSGSTSERMVFRRRTGNNNGNYLTILNGGNIGIGTISPTYLLTMVAPSVASSQLGIVSARTGIVSGNIVGGIDFISNDTSLTTPGSTTASILALANTTHTASALGTDLAFSVTNGTTTSEALRILGNGNVGIGTTTPGRSLVVSGLGMQIYRTGGAVPHLEIIQGGAGADLKNWRLNGETDGSFTIYPMTDANSNLRPLRYTHDGRLVIANAAGSAVDARLIVDTNNTASTSAVFLNGNVGIGTSSPDAKLTLQSSITGAAHDVFNLKDLAGITQLKAGISSGGSPSMIIGTQYTSLASASLVVDAGYGTAALFGRGTGATISMDFASVLPKIVIQNSGKSFSVGVSSNTFRITDGTTLGTNDRFVIDTNGNVGIGTSTFTGGALPTPGTTKFLVSGSSGTGMVINDTSSFANFSAIGATEGNFSIGDSGAATGSRIWNFNSNNGILSIRRLDDTQSSVSATPLTILLNGNVGIGTTSPVSKLSVAGAINSTDLLGGATTLSTDANGNIIRTPSDQKLKTNVETLTSALDKVNAMRGVSYTWLDTTRFGTSTEIGFIAQELETIVPEVVKSGGEYKSVNYQNLTALLTEAIKELSAKVNSISAWFDGKTFRVQEDSKFQMDGLMCADDVCVTKEQFKNLLRQATQNGGNSSTNTSAPIAPTQDNITEEPADPEPVAEQPQAPEPAQTPAPEAPAAE